MPWYSMNYFYSTFLYWCWKFQTTLNFIWASNSCDISSGNIPTPHTKGRLQKFSVKMKVFCSKSVVNDVTQPLTYQKPPFSRASFLWARVSARHVLICAYHPVPAALPQLRQKCADAAILPVPARLAHSPLQILLSVASFRVDSKSINRRFFFCEINEKFMKIQWISKQRTKILWYKVMIQDIVWN